VAAFFAISVRSSGVSFLALALPPLSPPSRPSVTAAGFFSGGSSGFSICPVAISIVSYARTFRSGFPRPRLVDLFGMIPACGNRNAKSRRLGFIRFQTEPLPVTGSGSIGFLRSRGASAGQCTAWGALRNSGRARAAIRTISISAGNMLRRDGLLHYFPCRFGLCRRFLSDCRFQRIDRRIHISKLILQIANKTV
jgi:hypothetical protein